MIPVKGMKSEDEIAAEIKERKLRFARAFRLYPNDPIRAASVSVDSNPANAAFIAQQWAFDAEVQAYMREMREGDKTGPLPDVPTKEEFAASLWRDAGDMKDKETKLDYLKLLAQVMGYIEKPANTVINNNNSIQDNRKVILLPPRQSAEEWQNNKPAKVIDAKAS